MIASKALHTDRQRESIRRSRDGSNLFFAQESSSKVRDSTRFAVSKKVCMLAFDKSALSIRLLRYSRDLVFTLFQLHTNHDTDSASNSR